MAKYFKNITSYEELKNTYRALIKANHPDGGGSVETMQEINCEYDALFKIWKDRAIKDETITEEQKNETAESTRKSFYTAFGWAGSRYDSNMALKEISKIVKNYTKEKYPTCKFSVRTHYASMCRELTVEIKEFPEQMYKTGDDLRSEGLREHVITTDYNGDPFEYDHYTEEVEEMMRRLRANGFFDLDSWTDEDLISAYEKAVSSSTFYAIQTDYFKSVIDDVDAFVNSYNYSDCDGMQDYFDVNFYYFGCKFSDCAFVPKTARIKEPKNDVTAAGSASDDASASVSYTIEESQHTNTGETIYLVKPCARLDRDTFNSERDRMKEHGGYYSRYTHSFVFSAYPSFLSASDESAAEDAEAPVDLIKCDADVPESEHVEADAACSASEPAADEPQENVLDSFFSRYGSASDTAEHTIHLFARKASDYHKEADVMRAIERTTEDIACLEKYIACLKAHQKQLVDQYNYLATSPVRKKIRLERKKNTWTNKVLYYIVYLDVNLNDLSEVETSRTTYTGKERKQAIDDFNHLVACNPGYISEKDIDIPAWER